MAATKISWCDEVWNPVVGCTRVSAGCDNCYAFALHDKRYAANLAAARAVGTKTTSIADVRATLTASHRGHLLRKPGKPDYPLPWPKQYDLPFSKVQLLPDRLDAPLRWKKPRRIFVDSMSDLFHEDVPDGYLDAVFGVMGAASQHTFLVLTKRPERMLRYLTFTEGWRWDGGELHNAPLPNVLLGVSVEDQATADERIPLLLRTPAAKRFVSAEPLLGPVDLRPTWLGFVEAGYDHGSGKRLLGHHSMAGIFPKVPRLDWVIVGGETGKGHRPMNLDWPRSLRDQCQAAAVAFFYKQGSGSQPGKHRILDGRTWEEMPC